MCILSLRGEAEMDIPDPKGRYYSCITDRPGIIRKWRAFTVNSE